MTSPHPRQIRIVVFDGENTSEVGAWPDLLTFEEMIDRLAHDEGSKLDEMHPCHYFDFIVGTGEGGLLALLFGRLNMTVPEVKSVYQDIRNISRANTSPDERAICLEQFLQKMIGETTGNMDTLIQSTGSKSSPSVAVLTSTPANTSFPVPLRTYRVRSNNTVDCAIWQAIRAAMSSPARFSPINIAGETYASASQVGHNNPIDFVLSEYRQVFPESTLGCIISIGSGHPGHNSYDPANDESMRQHDARFVADSERHFQYACRRLEDIGKRDVYFRLNVIQGLQLNTLGDDNVLGAVASHVRAYLSEETPNRLLDGALDTLKKLQPGETSPQSLNDMVGEPQVREELTHDEKEIESIISELISGENAYVKDLENIGAMYIQPLLDARPPLFSQPGLDSLISFCFKNYAELYHHHQQLLSKLHKLQRDEHCVIKSIIPVMLDAVLQFREAYLTYIPNCPMAVSRINSEIKGNPNFKVFVNQCTHHSNAHGLDMQHFIGLPISRLSKYENLLELIHGKTPSGHGDKSEISYTLELIRAIRTETEPSVASYRQKVELWHYNERLVFGPGESVDMDLLDETRSLIFAGRLMSRQEGGLDWSELVVILFDNYLVITSPVGEGEGVVYEVAQRPILLDLLTIISANDRPIRGVSSPNLRQTDSEPSFRSNMPMLLHHESGYSSSSNSPSHSHLLYPLILRQLGRMSCTHSLFAESETTRQEWTRMLEEALTFRKVFQEANITFGIKTLSIDTFFLPNLRDGQERSVHRSRHLWQLSHPGCHAERVTGSIPLASVGGRAFFAIGSEEGIWAGFENDPKSMKRVLQLKMVKQCAVLEDFGLFLVLLAYQVEAFIPSSSPTPQMSQAPQKLSGTKDVHLFSAGKIKDRTLVIYSHKKSSESTFTVLEPVMSMIVEGRRQPARFRSKLGLNTSASKWFRGYREFSLPYEAFDMIFLNGKIAIIGYHGFEILDIDDSKSMTVPQSDGPSVAHLKARCQQCRPIAIHYSTDSVFLLCYNEFGVFTDENGKPTTGIVIEWEGRAESAIQCSSYILLFNPSFIEVRSIETGRFIQFIDGHNIRCVWNGRGKSDSYETSGARSVYALSETVRDGGQLPSMSQHMFELIPTLPVGYGS